MRDASRRGRHLIDPASRARCGRPDWFGIERASRPPCLAHMAWDLSGGRERASLRIFVEESLCIRRRECRSPRQPGSFRRHLAPTLLSLIAAGRSSARCATQVENGARPVRRGRPKRNDQRALLVEPYAGGASVALELLAFGFVERIALGDRIRSSPRSGRRCSRTRTGCARRSRHAARPGTWERMKRRAFTGRRNRALACLYLNRTSFNGALHRRAGPIGGKNARARTTRLPLPARAARPADPCLRGARRPRRVRRCRRRDERR